jgi:hypothetical protein
MQARFSIACNDKTQAETSIERLNSICKTESNNNIHLLDMHCQYLHVLHQTLCGNLRQAHELAREAAKHIRPGLYDGPMTVCRY